MSAPTVERARDAVARESWAEAYALLHEQDRHPTRALTAGDLSALADAAWWAGHVDESVAARLRAHAACLAADDHRGAGLAAWWLHREYRALGRPAAAAGWLHRARHHLEGLPPCPEQCFLAWSDAEEAEVRGDHAAALAATRRMTRLALRSAGPDLPALSRLAEASVLLARGSRTEGLALLDETMRGVSSGGLGGLSTGRLYDLALTLCLRAADLPRAAEWTNAAMEWCAPPWTGRRPGGGTDPAAGPHADGGPVSGPAPEARAGPMAVPAGENPFRGVIRAHRVEVLDLLGAWALAEAEARQACREVPVDCLDSAAASYVAAGDVQRRQGRFGEAAVSYAHAHELGRVPQPGLALLRLAQGRADAAVTGLRLALAHPPGGRHDLLGRARLLGARTEVALALGDVRGATEAAAELDALAGDVPLLRAMADTARGAVTLADGPTAEPVRDAPDGTPAPADRRAGRHRRNHPDRAAGPPAAEPGLRDSRAGSGAGRARAPERALPTLRRALAGWLALRVPYEAARVRMLLAAAERDAGNVAAARRELAAARAVFERLGAVPDARRAAALLASGTRRRLPGGLTAREAEVLRLVASGAADKDVARALAIGEHTVAGHLNHVCAKLGVGSRAAAAAFAYAHGLV